VTHYIVPGGAYASAYVKLASTGFHLSWQPQPWGEERKKKAASKTKYTCPVCGTNAWAKPGTVLIYGECYAVTEGEVVVLQAEMPAEQQEAA
jgi:hypothetical protein